MVLISRNTSKSISVTLLFLFLLNTAFLPYTNFIQSATVSSKSNSSLEELYSITHHYITVNFTDKDLIIQIKPINASVSCSCSKNSTCSTKSLSTNSTTTILEQTKTRIVILVNYSYNDTAHEALITEDLL